MSRPRMSDIEATPTQRLAGVLWLLLAVVVSVVQAVRVATRRTR